MDPQSILQRHEPSKAELQQQAGPGIAAMLGLLLADPKL